MKTVTATAAKNNFGGLLEDIAVHGRVGIVRHGRLVAIMVSPAAMPSDRDEPAVGKRVPRTHMIPSHLARAARVIRGPQDFGDD